MSLPNRQYASANFSLPQNLHDSQLSPITGEALALGKVIVANRSGSSIDVGVFYRQPNSYWNAGTITAASTPDYLDKTSNAQSTTANSFVNVFTTVNASGWLVASSEKFGAVSFVVNDPTATTGANIIVQYYNGSSMVNLTPIASPDFTTGSAAKRQVVFVAPGDWVVNTTAGVGGPANRYAIQIISVDASGGSVASISDVRVYTMIDFYPTLLDQNELLNDFSGNERQLPVGASLCAYAGGTANSANLMLVDYRALSRQV